MTRKRKKSYLLCILTLKWSTAILFAAPEMAVLIFPKLLYQDSYQSLSLLLSTHIRVNAASSPALSPKVQISTESHQGLRATSQLLFAETKHEDPVQAFRSFHLRCKHIQCLMAFTAGFSLATEINWASFLTCNIMSLSAVPIETKCYLCFWQENSDTSSAC